jgi:type III restriction enzyme
MDQMTAIVKGGTTFEDEVQLEPLSNERRFAKEHVDEQVAVFERGKAYGGWSRSLYAFATFDSSPEYTVAKAVDGTDEVVVWARLHINDIPIEWTSRGQKYNPDFAVVEEVDGERTSWLVEVKSNRDAGSEDVQAKRLAAITWANTVTNSEKAGTWRYLLLTEDDVAQTHGNWKQMKTLA